MECSGRLFFFQNDIGNQETAQCKKECDSTATTVFYKSQYRKTPYGYMKKKHFKECEKP